MNRNKYFPVEVHGRDKQILLNIIKHFIGPSTQIISDGWKTYSDLLNEDYVYDYVNHSIKFLNSEGGTVYKQNNEQFWKLLKWTAKIEGGPGQQDEIVAMI